MDGEAAASAALERAYLNGWLARGKKDAAECDAVTERYAPGGKGSPIPTTWPEVASRMCADRIRALAPPSAPPSPNDDRLLLLKALVSGVVSAGAVWRKRETRIVISGHCTDVPLDSEGFPILTDSLRAALTEATHD